MAILNFLLTEKHHQSIVRTLKWLQELNEEFEGYHYSILELMEGTEVLVKEQKVLDDHENKVDDLIARLEDLVATSEPVMPHASCMGDDRLGVRSNTYVEHLSQRLDQVHDYLMKVKRVMDVKELDVCSLERHKERLKSISADLPEMKRYMLLIAHYESLAERAAGMEEASFEVRVASKRQLKDINAKSSVSKETGLSEVKLPKVSVPTFDSKVLNWKNFWEQLDATIHSKTGFSDTMKLMYLQDILKDRPARFVIQRFTQTSESYEKAIKYLRECYDCPWLVQEEHICSIMDAAPVKSSSDKELHRLYDAATQHYRALNAAKNDSFDTVLTVILQ